MATDSGDVVFLIRMRKRDGAVPAEWRGSIYEVATGRRFYVSSGRDAADFIDARLADVTSPGNSEKPGD